MRLFRRVARQDCRLRTNLAYPALAGAAKSAPGVVIFLFLKRQVRHRAHELQNRHLLPLGLDIDGGPTGGAIPRQVVDIDRLRMRLGGT